MSRRSKALASLLLVYAAAATWATLGVARIAAAGVADHGGSIETALAFHLGGLEFVDIVTRLGALPARGVLVGALMLPWLLVGLAPLPRGRGWRAGASVGLAVLLAILVPYGAALFAGAEPTRELSSSSPPFTQLLHGLALSVVLAAPLLAAFVLARGGHRWGRRLFGFILLGPLTSAIAAAFLRRPLGLPLLLLDLPVLVGLLAALAVIALAWGLRLALESSGAQRIVTSTRAALVRRRPRLNLTTPRARHSTR